MTDVQKPHPMAGKHEGDRSEKGNPGIEFQMPQKHKDAQTTYEKQEDAPVDDLVRKLGDSFQKRIAIGK